MSDEKSSNGQKGTDLHSVSKEIPGSHLTAHLDLNHHYTLSVAPEIEKHPSTQLISVLAHEVRNPLTNITLSIELLKAVIKNNDQKAYLDIIQRSSARIDSLITELLHCHQADERQSEEHSIHQLLDEVLEMTKDRIKLKNIHIKKEYSGGDYKIAFNKSKIKIAFTNIVVNAIDAMGTEEGELAVVSKLINGKYIIQIEDNGCGISETNLKHIFRPFYTNKPGGLGLGLSTTYEILWANHVSVHVKSEEGIGTCFTLVFEENLSS